MKKLVLTLIVVLSVTTSVFSQTKKSKSEVMRYSLWSSVYKFSLIVDEYLDKEFVQQADVTNFLSYVYSNMPDSVQSSDFWFPYTVSKDKAMDFLKEQTKDMIGSKCDYSFVSWDGWDGETPYTGFRLNISHNGYNDQFMVIVNTTNEIRCIFSVNSKI
jgi:hypothetical protein